VCGKGAASTAYLLFIYCWVLFVLSTTHQVACVCELLAAAYMWDPPGSSFPVKIFLVVDQLRWLDIILRCTLFLTMPSVNLTLPMMHEPEAKIC
jgi:hypothetical protein